MISSASLSFSGTTKFCNWCDTHSLSSATDCGLMSSGDNEGVGLFVLSVGQCRGPPKTSKVSCMACFTCWSCDVPVVSPEND